MTKQLFFTSDLHISHQRILEICSNRQSFASTVEEHNEGLITKWNNKVSNEDVIIILGDFIMGLKKETIPLYIPRFNGKLILITGNHDLGFPYPKIGHKRLYLDNGIYKIYKTGLYNLKQLLIECDEKELANIVPSNINICHFPYKNSKDHERDPYEMKHDRYQYENNGEWLLSGHTHQPQHIQSYNNVHIGIDAKQWNFSPVPLQEILDIISSTNI